MNTNGGENESCEPDTEQWLRTRITVLEKHNKELIALAASIRDKALDDAIGQLNRHYNWLGIPQLVAAVEALKDESIVIGANDGL